MCPMSDGRGIYFEKVARVLGEPQGRAKAAASELFAAVAQQSEKPTFNRTVGSSIPSGGNERVTSFVGEAVGS